MKPYQDIGFIPWKIPWKYLEILHLSAGFGCLGLVDGWFEKQTPKQSAQITEQILTTNGATQFTLAKAKYTYEHICEYNKYIHLFVYLSIDLTK